MSRFHMKAVAAGTALALFSFSSMAHAQDCVWQSDVDTANQLWYEASNDVIRAEAEIDYFPYSNAYFDLDSEYYNAMGRCHTHYPGQTIDAREVLDCEDAALAAFEMGKSDALRELEYTLTNAEFVEDAAEAAYWALYARPRCEAE